MSIPKGYHLNLPYTTVLDGLRIELIHEEIVGVIDKQFFAYNQKMQKHVPQPTLKMLFSKLRTG